MGTTPLFHASTVEVASVLLEAGAKADVRSIKMASLTPMLFLAKDGKHDVVRRLAESKTGESALKERNSHLRCLYWRHIF